MNFEYFNTIVHMNLTYFINQFDSLTFQVCTHFHPFFFLLVITVTVWVCKLWLEWYLGNSVLCLSVAYALQNSVLWVGFFFCLCSYTAMHNNQNISDVLSSVQKIITSLDDVKLRVFVLNQILKGTFQFGHMDRVHAV